MVTLVYKSTEKSFSSLECFSGGWKKISITTLLKSILRKDLRNRIQQTFVSPKIEFELKQQNS
jgi:hypothetical protein